MRRDLGIPFEGATGTYNAITDVSGVTVGYATVIEGDSARTGVTIIHPRGGRNHEPVFAGTFAFNGNGEMTGAAWVDEGGLLEGPIGITNTHCVGVVRDTIIEWQAKNNALFQKWSCPVVAETADGWLNDMNAFHVKPEHVMLALENSKDGPIDEGNVGGGTGMICYEYKGGTGTSSRKLPEKLGGWTVGVLAQCNFGRRYQLTIAGVPVGQHLTDDAPFTNGENPFRQDDGSLIVIIATDAPLLPSSAQAIGETRCAWHGAHRLTGRERKRRYIPGVFHGPFRRSRFGAMKGSVEYIHNEFIDPLLFASAYATEEAIINSMIAAEAMTGHKELCVHALPHDKLQDVLRKYWESMNSSPVR